MSSRRGFPNRVHRLPPLLFWGGVLLVVPIGCHFLLREGHRAPENVTPRSTANIKQPDTFEAEPSNVASFPARDPESKSVASNPRGDGDTVVVDRDEFLRDLRKWASYDADAALAWLANLADEELRGAALESICFGLAESNPVRAVKLAVSSGLQDRPGAVPNLVQQWAAVDATSALAWVMKQPEGEQRNDCMARVALVYSRHVPADAARLVIDHIPPGAAQTEAAMMVLHQWANQDLRSAAAWVAMFPDGSLRTRAVAELEGISRQQEELRRQGQTTPGGSR